MNITKHQLTRLIQEVISEAEEMSKEEPSSGKEPVKGDPESMKHSVAHGEKSSETAIKLTIRGLKPGKAYKNFMSKLVYVAKLADLEVIKADIEKGGKSVMSISSNELKRGTEKQTKTWKGPEVNLTNLSPEEREQFADPELSPEERNRLIRLSRIAPGQDEEQWNQMTARDKETEKAKLRKRDAMLKAGTLETDPETGLPLDNTLWTDREWDKFNLGGDVKTATQATGEKAGKQVYRPGFGKGPARKLGVKPNIGSMSYTSKFQEGVVRRRR